MRKVSDFFVDMLLFLYIIIIIIIKFILYFSYLNIFNFTL